MYNKDRFNSKYKKMHVLALWQPPFYSRNTAEMYDNILHKPLRLRSNISESARTLLAGVSESVSYNVYTPDCYWG